MSRKVNRSYDTQIVNLVKRKRPPETRRGPFSTTGSSAAGRSRLELVAQGELHYARIGQQVGVVAERRSGIERAGDRLYVEARQVEGVEHFPAELQAVGIPPRHFPAL